MSLFKIVLLGDGAVGKTALKNRYMGKSFTGDYLMTIGADFASKEIVVDGINLKFQIWDLAGQPRFGAVRDLYYHGCMGGLVVYDVTRPDTYMHMTEWIKELWENNGKGNIPFVLVANKIDLRNQFPNAITEEYGKEYAKQLTSTISQTNFAIPYTETSAKTGVNVDLAFELLGREIIRFIKGNAAFQNLLRV